MARRCSGRSWVGKVQSAALGRHTVLILAGLLLGWVPALEAQTVLFQDTFHNGNPTQVKGESPHFWKTVNSGLGHYGRFSLTEKDGALVMEATNTSAQQAALGLSCASLQPFNFITGPVRFEVSGLSVHGSTPNASNLYFDVTAKATSTAYLDQGCTRFGLRLRGDNAMQLGWRINHPGPSVLGTALTSFMNLGPGAITGFQLTLDGSSWVARPATGGLKYDLRFACAPDNPSDSNHDGWIDSGDTGFASLAGQFSPADSAQFIKSWLAENGNVPAAQAKASLSFQDRVTAGAAGVSSTVELKKIAVVALLPAKDAGAGGRP